MRGLHLGHRTTSRKHWLLLFGMVIVVGVAEYVGWFAPLTSLVERVVVPAKVYGVRVVSVVTWPFRTIFLDYDKAIRIQELEQQYAVALAKIGELERVEKENGDLRRMLSTTSASTQREFVIAAVSSYASPTLAVGSGVGVQPGSLVLFSDTLLGLVSSVSDQQAKVDLLKQSGNRGVVARTESGAQGILRGDGKVLYLEEVPRNLAVQRGERVVTIGQEGIPEGIFVGVTGASVVADTAAVQSIVVDQLSSFYDASVVEVW